jgi:branched-chain amino acid transport system permease protein
MTAIRSRLSIPAEPTVRVALGAVSVLTMLLVVGLLTGGIGPAYLLYLLGLSGMYVLLAIGLNVQWGYTGMINFGWWLVSASRPSSRC